MIVSYFFIRFLLRKNAKHQSFFIYKRNQNKRIVLICSIRLSTRFIRYSFLFLIFSWQHSYRYIIV